MYENGKGMINQSIV